MKSVCLFVVAVFVVAATAATSSSRDPRRHLFGSVKQSEGSRLTYDPSMGTLEDVQKTDEDGNVIPVILVPGLACSQLVATEPDDSWTRIWVRIWYADSEFRKWGLGRVDPDSMWIEPYGDWEVDTVLDDFGLYAISKLDPDVYTRVSGLEAVYYYYDLIKALKKAGYEPGVTLFGMPHDWRQTSRHPSKMSTYRNVIETALATSGASKVRIVSHSMGGLVTKHLWAQDTSWFEDRVDSWVAMATPWNGAMGAMTDCQLQGYRFGLIGKKTAQAMCTSAPSIYELGPDAKFPWEPPTAVMYTTSDGEEVSVDAQDYWDFAEQAIVHTELDDNPYPWDPVVAEFAQESQRILREFTPSASSKVKFYSIVSIGVETAYHLVFDEPVDDVSDIGSNNMDHHEDYQDGDGTVPFQSAIADGLPAVARWKVEEVVHADVVKQKWVVNKILELFGAAEGVDLDEPLSEEELAEEEAAARASFKTSYSEADFDAVDWEAFSFSTLFGGHKREQEDEEA